MTRKVCALVLCLAVIAGISTATAATTASASTAIQTTDIQRTLRGGFNFLFWYCDFAYEYRTINRIIFKRQGVIGAITSATASNCSGGGLTSATVLVPVGGIPVSYLSFNGALPRISGMNLLASGIGIAFTGAFGTCLYGGNLSPVREVATGSTITGHDFTGTNALPRISGSALCPATISLTGTLAVAPPQPTWALI